MPDTIPPGRQAELDLQEQIEKITVTLRMLEDERQKINEDSLRPIIDDLINLGALIEQRHIPNHGSELVSDLTGLTAIADAWAKAAQAYSLPSRAIIVCNGAIDMAGKAAEEALKIAPGAGFHVQPRTDDVTIDAHGNRDSLSTLAREIHEVKAGLATLEAEITKPAPFRRQAEFLTSYITAMRVPVTQADLHLSLGRVRTNLSALTRAVAAMGRLTESFVRNAEAWTTLLTDAVKTGARRMLSAVDAVSGTMDRIVVSRVSELATPAVGAAEPGDKLPDMVRIPAGQFKMGAPEEESEREGVGSFDNRSRPIREIVIAKPFWLARHPVTRGQFAAFVRDTGHKMGNTAWTYERSLLGKWEDKQRRGRGWRNPGFSQTDDHPVVCVSHDDALAYIAWLNAKVGGGYRLPSEAEWEYAARAGTTTARYWGDTMDQAHRYANAGDQSLKHALGRGADGFVLSDGDDGFPFTSPVGSFSPNAFGLYDMLGNVWEWCADVWADTLKDHPANGLSNTTGDSSRRALRGGSWVDYPWGVRAATRVWSGTGGRSSNTGFRVART